MIHVFWPNDFKKDKGTILTPTAPFKGICNHCRKKAIVRNYAYNSFERLGTLCKDCFEEIDSEISNYTNFHEVEEWL